MKRPLSVLVTAVLCACVPEFGDDLARVKTPRILAVQATPAEVKPGQPVTLTALVASPGAAAGGDGIEWAMCLARKPLTELGPVAQECIDRFGLGGDIFARLGRGPIARGVIPVDACQRFGPLVPPAAANGIAGRPVDPDLSGGFQQPIVLGGELGTALGSVRLACGASGLPSEEATRFARGYRPNENPEIERLEIVGEGARPIEPSPSVTVVAAGARLRLRASWAVCPAEPVCGDGICSANEDQTSCAADCREAARGCAGSETYVWPNPETRRVSLRREAMSVGWFSDGGVFADEQTGRTESEAPAADASNVWTAPEAPSLVHAWIVIRDDRGGSGWRDYVLRVE